MPSNSAVFRQLALSLPHTIESAHMGHPDFRILGADGKLRIFATLAGETTGRGVLKLTLEQQSAFCLELPEVSEPVQGGWGRMGMTYVHLESVQRNVLLGALATAHRNIMTKVEIAAPKRKSALAKSATAKPRAMRKSAKPKIES